MKNEEIAGPNEDVDVGRGRSEPARTGGQGWKLYKLCTAVRRPPIIRPVLGCLPPTVEHLPVELQQEVGHRHRMFFVPPEPGTIADVWAPPFPIRVLGQFQEVSTELGSYPELAEGNADVDRASELLPSITASSE